MAMLGMFLVRGFVFGCSSHGNSPTQAPLGGSGCEFVRNLHLTDPPMFGNDVLELRNRLLRLGHDPGNPENDRYDAELASVVRRWQGQAGLIPDGVVGPATT